MLLIHLILEKHLIIGVIVDLLYFLHRLVLRLSSLELSLTHVTGISRAAVGVAAARVAHQIGILVFFGSGFEFGAIPPSLYPRFYARYILHYVVASDEK